MDLTSESPPPKPIAAPPKPIHAAADLSAQIDQAFTYHAPKGDQTQRYEQLRASAKNHAIMINAKCPHSRERSLALTHLEQSLMWAHAAIARNE